ncbi:hypothetical protein TWF481_003316 [Arthrobotrys musiformis]|uniref:BTB domain-containing protein n=1 Tax=Arthrobotrys musiformis TaxID=47236 RepID=A0AAV9VPV4_9PEZI
MRRAGSTTLRRLQTSSKPQWPVGVYDIGHGLSSHLRSTEPGSKHIRCSSSASTTGRISVAGTSNGRVRQQSPPQHILVSKRNKAAKKLIRARLDELQQKAIQIARVPRFDLTFQDAEKSEAQRGRWLKLLSTIEDSLDRKISRITFQSIAFAYRRLKAEELDLIIRFSFGGSDGEGCRAEDLPEDLFAQNIQRGLIEIDDHGYIMFKSKYFRQMLVAHRMHATGPQNSYFFARENTTHFEIAEALLRYMGTYGESGPCDSVKEQKEREAAYPLLRYAALYWPDHCIECYSLKQGLIDLAGKFWKSGNDSYYGAWLQAHHWYRGSPTAAVNPELQMSPFFKYIGWMDGALTRLASWGVPEFVKAALAEVPYTAAEKSLALNAAIKCGNNDIASILISNGADIKARGMTGIGNHLHDALFRRGASGSMLRHLLSVPGAVDLIDGIDESGRTPLHLAASKGKLDAVQVLLEFGATVDVPGDMGRTALHYAAIGGFPDVVECLLKAGANPNGMSYLKTPLHVSYGSRDLGHDGLNSRRVASLLLGAGADPKAQDADGFTPLNTAVVKNNSDVVKALLPHYSVEDINIIGRSSIREDSTALTSALLYGTSDDTIKALVDMKAKGPLGTSGRLIGDLVDGSSKLTTRAVDLILQNFPEEVAAYESATGKTLLENLLSAYPPPTRKVVHFVEKSIPNWRDKIFANYDPYPGSNMEGKVRAGDVGDVVSYAKTLENQGADFPWEEIWGTISDPPTYPLSYHPDVRALIRFRPEFNTPEYLVPALCNSFSWTDNKEVVALFYMNLVERLPGTPLVDYVDEETGMTVLHQACELSHYRVVERLLTVHGANVNIQDNEGMTPLMRCFSQKPIFNWSRGTIQKLMEHGADPTIRDNQNRTAVTHVAACPHWNAGKVENVLDILLQHPNTKSIIDLPDASGLRPIEHAHHGNLHSLVKELIAAGAKLNPKDGNGAELLSRLSVRWSSYARRLPLAEELISMGQDIYALNDDGSCFAQECLGYYGDTFHITYLTEHPKFDPTAPFPRREGDETPPELPFHYAIKNCRQKAVLLLTLVTPEQREKLVHGRSLDGKDSTSLHLAVKTGAVGLVRFLIEAGADVNAVDSEGRTPLFFISRRGPGLSMAEGATVEAVTCGYWLLKAGADPNFRNEKTGRTVCESIRDYEGFDLKGSALRLLKDFGARDAGL